MGRLSTVRAVELLAAMALTLAAGCCTPDSARVAWSANAPVARPLGLDQRGKTTLIVRTASNGPSHFEGECYQGYAVFTASGTLLSSAGESTVDVAHLHPEPGDYVVVTRVRDGFSCQLVTAQARVEQGCTTVVDFTAPR